MAPPPVWTPERTAELYQRYVVEGWGAKACGDFFGCTDRAVRALSSKLKWKRDPAFHLAAVTRANQLHGARGRTRAEKPPTPAMAERRMAPRLSAAPVDGDDQALIADFLARQGATVCPPGYACGLTKIEAVFHAAGPPRTGWKEAQARARAHALLRKRVAA